METTSPRRPALVFRVGLIVAMASACDGADPSRIPVQPRGKGGSASGDGGSSTSGSAMGGAGSGGLGGVAVSGGVSGVSGESGEGGEAGTTGGKGGGTSDPCGFQIEGRLSAIQTVGVVDWSIDLPELSEARIEFSLVDPAPGEINRGSGGAIDVSGTTHRALMLGLKPDRTYTYRIVATGDDEVCTSADRSLTTGSSPGAPTVTRTVVDADARAHGFIVTSGGYPGSTQAAYIIDADGDVVWWAFSPRECSHALMDWEGANMWMVSTNPASVVGEVSSIGMDGERALNGVEGLSYAHHDLAVAPGGIVAALVWNLDGSGSSDLVERSPDGTLRTVVRIGSNLFESLTGSASFHPNAVQYHPRDDTYTVSDPYARAIVKVTREGEPVWQIGENCEGAAAPKCASAEIVGSHGHHLLENGNLLYFAAASSSSFVHEFEFTESSESFDATEIWSYVDEEGGAFSLVLGDVQRLPNGNTLVVYSTEGKMHEVSAEGELVQIFEANPPAGTSAYSDFGYANFRETLYGQPLR
jgi:hypothetical protein